jgi:MFS transporter, Spinster family, sphingosine-1-phosphate transporter
MSSNLRPVPSRESTGSRRRAGRLVLGVPESDGSEAGLVAGPREPGEAATAGPKRSHLPRWAWGALGILFLSHLLDSFDRWLLPAVLQPLSQEMELTEDQTGWLATVMLVSFAVWSPIAGYLADRFRRPRLLAVGMAVWSLATVSTGLARSYNQIQMARVLVGVGGSTFGVVGLTMLMDLFPRDVRARVLSTYSLAMPIGAALGVSLGSAIARIATWQTAFLVAGAPGVILALLVLILPDPVRGASEGLDETRLKLHERWGPSQEDYIDLMVNSSYTYSVFGLAFSMFAIGGLVYWLPSFLMVVKEIPAERVTMWLSFVIPAAVSLGMVTGGWLADRLLAVNPRLPFLIPGLAILGSIPFLILAIYGRSEGVIVVSLLAAIALMFTNTGPCYAIIASVVLPNMRGVACAVALAAVTLLGDIWSPALMGWVAETFGEADSMATPFGHALAAIGAIPRAQPGHDPENLTAALLSAVPAVVIAGVVLLAGARHLPREMALMLAKLRSVPSRGVGRNLKPPVAS